MINYFDIISKIIFQLANNMDVQFSYFLKFEVKWNGVLPNNNLIRDNVGGLVNFSEGEFQIDGYEVTVDGISEMDDFSLESKEVCFYKIVTIPNEFFELDENEIQDYYRKIARIGTSVSKRLTLENGVEIIANSFVFQSIWPDDIPWFNGPDMNFELIEDDFESKEPCEE
jgi:hypothetical protein